MKSFLVDLARSSIMWLKKDSFELSFNWIHQNIKYWLVKSCLVITKRREFPNCRELRIFLIVSSLSFVHQPSDGRCGKVVFFFRSIPEARFECATKQSALVSFQLYELECLASLERKQFQLCLLWSLNAGLTYWTIPLLDFTFNLPRGSVLSKTLAQLYLTRRNWMLSPLQFGCLWSTLKQELTKAINVKNKYLYYVLYMF